MKILIVTDLYPIIEDNTIPNIVKSFTSALKENNNDVVVVRSNFIINSYIRHHKVVKGGEYYVDDIKIYNRNFLLPFVFENKKFIQKLKEEGFDIIISHMPSGHIYSFLINKYLKIKHIAIVHQSDYVVLNDFKYKFYFRNKLKKSLKNASLIGARNIFLKEKLKASFLLPSFVEEKNIIENKKFNNSKLKIITLSKLIKRKNIDKVIIALSKIDFDFKYSIYGEGIEKNKLEKLIKKYNLEEKIKIYPYIKHNLINEVLDKNDVFILPSINETFGVSYFEALSRGLITIASKNTGIDGIITNNQDGFLIAPNIIEIINVLNEINQLSQDEKEKMSKNAINLIKDYTKEKVIEKYTEIFS